MAGHPEVAGKTSRGRAGRGQRPRLRPDPFV